jgi:uncharacterized repeat protein (TIGR03803 family)
MRQKKSWYAIIDAAAYLAFRRSVAKSLGMLLSKGLGRFAGTKRSIMTRPPQGWEWISRVRLQAARVALALAAVLVLPVLATRSAQAQNFNILYTFNGPPDGAYPRGGLVRDAAGNLYGTTGNGGRARCLPSGPGCGLVFKLSASGKEAVLHRFNHKDGAVPIGELLRDAAGNLYGTASVGGLSRSGVVFKVDTTGKETVLYSFTGAINRGDGDGYLPSAGLVRDATGNLYGTTQQGGMPRYENNGTVFKLDANGKETVLHSFTGPPDGRYPVARLVRDAAGNLYGTTRAGGITGTTCNGNDGCGVVFKIDSTGKETVLYSFTGGPDGAYPSGGLVRDAAGNIYGTAGQGGDSSGGVVFKLDTTGKETVLHSFTGNPDGVYPSGGLIRDATGTLYGTTESGGTAGFYGVVFKLDTTGKETVLYSFTGGADGAYPGGRLVRDTAGNLYGTTGGGGNTACTNGCGTVFKITP